SDSCYGTAISNEISEGICSGNNSCCILDFPYSLNIPDDEPDTPVDEVEQCGYYGYAGECIDENDCYGAAISNEISEGICSGDKVCCISF
ncbi:hypothetical protein BCR32DRAFT_288714, partial [Anaeromyces robustus]